APVGVVGVELQGVFGGGLVVLLLGLVLPVFGLVVGRGRRAAGARRAGSGRCGGRSAERRALAGAVGGLLEILGQFIGAEAVEPAVEGDGEDVIAAVGDGVAVGQEVEDLAVGTETRRVVHVGVAGEIDGFGGVGARLGEGVEEPDVGV